MSDDEPAGTDAARTPADLARQLRDAADRLMAGWSAAVPGLPAGTLPGAALPGFPLPPATLSAQQLQVVLDDLAARRAQVQALRAQLGTFDQQLGTLEASLQPLLEWARTWAGVEGAVADFLRLPGRPGEER